MIGQLLRGLYQNVYTKIDGATIISRLLSSIPYRFIHPFIEQDMWVTRAEFKERGASVMDGKSL